MFGRERGGPPPEARERRPSKTELAALLLIGGLGLATSSEAHAETPVDQAKTTIEHIDEGAQQAQDVVETGTEAANELGIHIEGETVFETNIDPAAEGEERAEAVDQVVSQAISCIEGEGAIEKGTRVMILAENIRSLDGILDAARVAQGCTDLGADLDLIKAHPKWNATLKDSASIGLKLVVGDREGATKDVVDHAKEGAVKLGVVRLSEDGSLALTRMHKEGKRLGDQAEELSSTTDADLEANPKWKQTLHGGIAQKLNPGAKGIGKILRNSSLDMQDVLDASSYTVGYSLSQVADSGLGLEFDGTLMASRSGDSFDGLAGLVSAGINPEGRILGRDVSTGIMASVNLDGLQTGSYLQLDTGHRRVKAIATIDQKGNIGSQVMYEVSFGIGE